MAPRPGDDEHVRRRPTPSSFEDRRIRVEVAEVELLLQPVVAAHLRRPRALALDDVARAAPPAAGSVARAGTRGGSPAGARSPSPSRPGCAAAARRDDLRVRVVRERDVRPRAPRPARGAQPCASPSSTAVAARAAETRRPSTTSASGQRSRASSTVWAWSRTVTATSWPRSSSARAIGAKSSGCGEFEQSIQTFTLQRPARAEGASARAASAPPPSARAASRTVQKRSRW